MRMKLMWGDWEAEWWWCSSSLIVDSNCLSSHAVAATVKEEEGRTHCPFQLREEKYQKSISRPQSAALPSMYQLCSDCGLACHLSVATAILLQISGFKFQLISNKKFVSQSFSFVYLKNDACYAHLICPIFSSQHNIGPHVGVGVGWM